MTLATLRQPVFRQLLRPSCPDCGALDDCFEGNKTLIMHLPKCDECEAIRQELFSLLEFSRQSKAGPTATLSSLRRGLTNVRPMKPTHGVCAPDCQL